MDDQTTDEGRKWTHREDNRERLIAAGYTIMSEKGVEGATVKEIARLAGVSPGLFHYYFASKNELLLAVLWEAGQRFAAHLQAELSTLSTEMFPAAALVKAHQVGYKDPAWYRLRYELFALGLRNPDFLPAIGQYMAATRNAIVGTLQASGGISTGRAQALAAVLLACVDGLALQHFAEPDVDQNAAYAVVEEIISAGQA